MTSTFQLEHYSNLFLGDWKTKNQESKNRLILSRIVSTDTETTGLDKYDASVQTTHVSYWTNAGKGKAFAVDNHEERNKVAKFGASLAVTKLLFNAKFDFVTLEKAGVILSGPVIDVLLIAQLLLPNEKKKKLKQLARKLLKYPYLEETRLKQWLKANKTKNFGLAPKHIIEPYALADAIQNLELFYFLAPGLDKHQLWSVLEREMMLMRDVVMPMEEYGAMIDLKEVDALKIKTAKVLKELKTKLVELTGKPDFNPNSSAQVAAAIYNGSVKPTRFSRKTGKPKVDMVAILQQPSEVGILIAQYRKIAKARTTYLKNFNKPILRVNFNQGGTRTGRFSSSGPNLQNIPRPSEDSLLGQMRKVFVARPGSKLLFIDYRQIEMRLAAHFSGEEHMLQAINDNIDLHDVTCKLIFNITPDHPDWIKLRYIAKTLNFAILYGTGAETFSFTVLKNTNGKMRISTYEAARYIGEYQSKHPKIMKMFGTVTNEVAKTGGVVNHYGRWMEVDPRKPYVGVNYKIQGTAADFMKMKMYPVASMLQGRRTKLFLTVHDELGFNLYKEDAKLVKPIVEVMQDNTTFSVPLTCSVSYGDNWHTKKELKL